LSVANNNKSKSKYCNPTNNLLNIFIETTDNAHKTRVFDINVTPNKGPHIHNRDQQPKSLSPFKPIEKFTPTRPRKRRINASIKEDENILYEKFKKKNSLLLKIYKENKNVIVSTVSDKKKKRQLGIKFNTDNNLPTKLNKLNLMINTHFNVRRYKSEKLIYKSWEIFNKKFKTGEEQQINGIKKEKGNITLFLL